MVRPNWYILYLPYHQHPIHHLTEHYVLIVQVVTSCAGDEELAAVRVFPAVSHGQDASTLVL